MNRYQQQLIQLNGLPPIDMRDVAYVQVQSDGRVCGAWRADEMNCCGL